MYDDLVKTMFECLQQMAKMGGESGDADKDSLNYHVVLSAFSHFVLSCFAHALARSRKHASLYDDDAESARLSTFCEAGARALR